MFTNGALKQRISEIHGTPTLVRFIRRYNKALPNQIYMDISEQIKKMPDVYWNSDIISALFLERDKLRDCDYTILFTYANSLTDVDTSAELVHQDTELRTAMIATLLAIDLTKPENLRWNPSSDIYQIFIPDLVIELLGFIFPCEPDFETYREILSNINEREFWDNWLSFDWLNDNIPNQELLIGLLQYAEIQKNYSVRLKFFDAFHEVYRKHIRLEEALGRVVEEFNPNKVYLFESIEEAQCYAMCITQSLMEDYSFDRVFFEFVEAKGISEEETYRKFVMFCNMVICAIANTQVPEDTLLQCKRAKSILDSITFKQVLISIDLEKNRAGYESWLAQESQSSAMEKYSKLSTTMQQTSQKIYNGYKAYKQKEDVVDSQLTKMLRSAKKAFVGDTKKAVIEGKEWTAIGLLKEALRTAAIFSFGPIKGMILFVVQRTLRKNSTRAERKKVMMELEEELEIINEKIEDAKGDGNRQAKYAMMRTRAELQNALKRIKFGIEADERSTSTAKSVLNGARSEAAEDDIGGES